MFPFAFGNWNRKPCSYSVDMYVCTYVCKVRIPTQVEECLLDVKKMAVSLVSNLCSHKATHISFSRQHHEVGGSRGVVEQPVALVEARGRKRVGCPGLTCVSGHKQLCLVPRHNEHLKKEE